jgi:hypothetical protein
LTTASRLRAKQAARLGVWIVAACLCVCALAQEPTPAPAPVSSTPSAPAATANPYLQAADEAARAYDYVTASKLLEQAAAGAAEPLVAQIKQRLTLYEQFLAMTDLLQQANDNPDHMVGTGTTRGGRQLSGLLHMFELGIIPGARFGNRALDEGSLALKVGGDNVRRMTAREIAQVFVEWLQPKTDAWPNYWTIGKIRVVLQTGEVVEGTPTWILPLSTLTVRPAGKDEDDSVSAYPLSPKGFSPDNLVSEVTILGAPPAPAPPKAE